MGVTSARVLGQQLGEQNDHHWRTPRAAALVFGVDLIFQNHHYHVITPTVFGEGLGFHSEAPIFIVGMITGAAIVLGFALVVSEFAIRGSGRAGNVATGGTCEKHEISEMI